MNSFLCWLNVQIAGNSLHLIFDLIVSWYISAIVAVKKKKKKKKKKVTLASNPI